MKTPSDELFKLVKSLNTQEKVQFKLYASRKKEDSNCITLFDALAKQKTYNEEQVKLKLKNEPFLKNLPWAKHYLYESILKCMQEYHAIDSVESALCNNIQQIEFLINKRLFNTAKKLIQKAELLATKNHCYPYLFTILSWKQKIMLKEINVAGFADYKRTHHLSELQYAKWHLNVLEYQHINVLVAELFYTQFENPDEKATTELNKMLKALLLQSEKKALSFPAKVMYYRILGDINLMLKQWRKSCHYYQYAVACFEQAKLTPNDRLIVFIRLAIALSQLKKSDKLLLVKDAAEKLVKALPKKLQTIGLYAPYLSLMINYIFYQLSVLNMDDAFATSDEIENEVEKYANPQDFLIYYQSRSFIYLFTPDYRKALYCVNKVLATEKTGIRKDIISLTKILSLVIHYELGNEDLLPNLCWSYSSCFNEQKRQYKAENILLNFFGKTLHATLREKSTGSNKQNRIKLFTALKKELEPHKTESIFKQFDFISWCDSKIQNRPMIEIMKKKLK